MGLIAIFATNKKDMRKKQKKAKEDSRESFWQRVVAVVSRI